MSRRKQARPRLVKREDEDGEDGLKDEELDVEPDAKIRRTSSSTGEDEAKITVDKMEGRNGTSTAKDPETFRCETCGATFNNLVQFMDHRNLECDGADSQWNLENGSRSDTPSSMDSMETDKLGSPLRDSLSSPSLLNLEPDQVPFTVGVSDSNPYGCQFCDRAFARLSHLKIHEQVHADLMPFSCTYCRRLFRHKRSRDRHMKLHTGDKKYKCTQCDSAFARSDHLKSHLKTHDTYKPFQCTVCNRGYTSMAALTSHMTSHKESPLNQLDEVRCLECHDLFTSVKEMEQHSCCHGYQGSQKTLPCPHCPAVCVGQSALDDHVENIHSSDTDGQDSKCPVCLKSFLTLDELTAHMKVHDIPGLQTDSLLSSSDMAAAYSLTKSILQGTANGKLCGSEVLVCPYCLRDNFETLEGLEIHMQSVHSVKPTEVYTCNYCNAPYKNLYSLHEHMRAVHQNQPSMGIKYPCSRCSKEFPSIETLSEHKKKYHHFGTKSKPPPPPPVVDSVYCVQCSMTFPSPALLQDHVSVSHKEPAHKSDERETGKRPSIKSPKFSLSSFQESYLPSRSSTESLLGPIINVPEPSTILHLTRPPSGGGEANQEKLTCDQCSAVFQDKAGFQAHLKLHLDSAVGQYACKKCCKAFLTEELLECHLSTHYLSTMTEYGCTSCLKLFTKPDELQKHLMDIHAHHLYRCSLCKEIFDSKVNIQVHFAIKHSNECKLHKCVQCDTIFRSETEWQVHVRVAHLHMTKPYRCLFCKESFSTEMDLQCHLATHNKPFKCSMCDESFLVEFLLDKHLQSVHSSGSSGSQPSLSALDGSLAPVTVKIEQDMDPVKAEWIGTGTPSRFPSSSSSTGSLVWRNSEDLYRCNICDQKFSQVASLQTHKLQDHGVKVSPLKSSYSPGSSPQGSTASGDRCSDTSAKSLPRSLYLSVPSPASISMATASASSALTEALKSTMSLPLNVPEPPTAFSEKLASTFGEKLSLACPFCSQTFKCKTDLEKHSKIHVNTGSQKCNICDEVFASTGILAEHKLQHCKIQQGNICVACKIPLRSEDQFYLHSQEHGFQGAIMQCIICRQTLASMVELQMHGKHHFQNKPTFYTCCVCLKSFDSNENLISKLNSSGRTYYVCKPCYHGDASEYPCSQCGAKFGTNAQLESHMSTHKQTFQCIKCQESFSSEYEIQLHVASHMMKEGNSHECKLCFTVLDSPARLQSHLIEHTYKNSELRCSVCCKTFSTPTEIQSHALEHGLSARRYGCSQCNQKFFFSAELENHMFIHKNQSLKLSPSSINPDLKCTECDQTFATLASLWSHYRLHEKSSETVSKVTKCSQCSQVFPSLVALQTHCEAAHPGGDRAARSTAEGGSHRKTYQCPECECECPSLGTLQAHMNVHKTGTALSCPICKKVFTSAKNLTVHMHSHSGEKPYQCPVCRKGFSRKENRKIHMKTHAELKSHLCPLCRKAFSSKSQVQDHIRTHYPQTGSLAALGVSEVEVLNSESASSSEDNNLISSHISEAELSDLDEGDLSQEVTSTSNIPDEELGQ